MCVWQVLSACVAQFLPSSFLSSWDKKGEEGQTEKDPPPNSNPPVPPSLPPLELDELSLERIVTTK